MSERSTDVDERVPPPAASPPPLRPVELLRWAWRQLTSMRTALVLLLLLALAAVPGSVVPQANIDSVGVTRWQEAHPALAPVYERLGLFSVYDSVWFSAVYILLMVSLVGCILPRCGVYWRALRAQPPKAPRNLDRLPACRRVLTDEPPDVVLDRARQVLRRRRYRTTTRGTAVSAERGHLREAGNLLFHVSVLVVLVGFAVGQLFGYKGSAIVLVGSGFSNSLTQYDDFAPGSLFDADDLAPLSFSVDDFDVEFLTSGERRGQPVDFGADVTYKESPDAEPRRYRLRVNHPLALDGVRVFLVGHGYAPVVTVKDGNGDVAYSGPVVFLPQDASFASYGVVKAPDARPDQLGFEGFFLPTYEFDMDRGPYSSFPDLLNPAITLEAYAGDLGMDHGRPQSVYLLDTDEMTKLTKTRGGMFRADLTPGRGVTLPDGKGSIELNGVQRWVKLQVSDTPGRGLALGGVVLALLGLMGSLFVRPRRTWVRVTRPAGPDGRTLVEVAGLDRGSAGVGLDQEVAELAEQVAPPTHPTSQEPS
jgi:cytochrome c biogenesis protein